MVRDVPICRSFPEVHAWHISDSVSQGSKASGKGRPAQHGEGYKSSREIEEWIESPCPIVGISPAGYFGDEISHVGSVVPLCVSEPNGRGTNLKCAKGAPADEWATGIDFCGHDLRRTAASQMTSNGIPRLTVGKILNHVEPGVTKVYDRYSYNKEKREALEAWGRRLMIMVSDLREAKTEV